jgi:hypothetical protein
VLLSKYVVPNFSKDRTASSFRVKQSKNEVCKWFVLQEGALQTHAAVKEGLVILNLTEGDSENLVYICIYIKFYFYCVTILFLPNVLHCLI